MTQPTTPVPISQQIVRAIPSALWAIVALVLAILLASSNATARRNGLRADSLSALTDTMRRTDSSTFLRAMQSAIRADVQEALAKQSPAVVIRDTIKAPVVHDTVYAEVSGDSIRSAHFDVREAPYTSHADVELPKLGPGKLALSIQQDPIPLETRVECGQAVDGIKPAQVRITAPPIYRVGLSQPQVNPDVCNAAPIYVHSIPVKPALAIGLSLFLLGWLRP